MSQALCPECQATSNVIETRAAFNSLRRRRRCTNSHKFTTIEVSNETPKKIVELVQWAIRNGVTENFEQYVHEVMFGLPCEETTKEPEQQLAA